MPQQLPISIIIPHLRGKDRLASCLESLYSSTVLPAEVIIVDNGSVDGSWLDFRQRFPQPRILHLPWNFGFAGAVNAGINVSEQPYLGILNDDAYVERRWLEYLFAAAQACPEPTIVAPLVLRPGPQPIIDSAGDGLTEFGTAFQIGSGCHLRSMFSQPREVLAAAFTAVVIPRSIIEVVGVLADYYFAYLEDMQFCLRAGLQGFSIRLVPEAIAYHQGQATSNGFHKPWNTYYRARNSLWLVQEFTGILFPPGYHRHWAGIARTMVSHLILRPTVVQAFLSGLHDGRSMPHRAVAQSSAMWLYPSRQLQGSAARTHLLELMNQSNRWLTLTRALQDSRPG